MGTPGPKADEVVINCLADQRARRRSFRRNHYLPGEKALHEKAQGATRRANAAVQDEGWARTDRGDGADHPVPSA